jgi:hypothetical protein
MGSHTLLRERLRGAAEVLILALACLSPWAIGAVDAWAQLIFEGGLVLLAALGLFTAERSNWARRLFCLPSMTLAALALLALLQALPLPDAVVRTIAPATQLWRSGLAPGVPQRVQGDDGPPVAPPASTLSHDPEASLCTAAQLASYWILFQCVLGLGRGHGPLRRFGLATVANASLMTLFAIAQALAWGGKIYGIRPVTERSGWLTGGPFVCHNHLAAYLNLAFGLALGFLLATLQEFPHPRSRRKGRGSSSRRFAPGKSLWAGYAAGLIFAGVVASHSRGGFLALLISTALTIFILRPNSVRIGPSLGFMLAVTALFLIATGTASPFQRLASVADPTNPEYGGVAGRIEGWGVALRAWRAFPIWGTGLGSFPAATAPFYRAQFGSFYFSHAENEYVQMLTEGGIVGLLLALLTLLGIALMARRARDAAPTSRERALVLGASMAVLSLSIQCLSDFPMHIPGVAITAVVVAAHLCRLGLEAGAREADAGASTPRAGPVLVGLAMVGLGVAIVFLGLRLARAEALVTGVGLPYPGSLMVTVDPERRSDDELNRARAALEEALRSRPNWAEGHLRLGAVLLGLYSNLAERWLGEFHDAKSPAALAILSDPSWLHGVVHSASAEEMAKLGGVLDQEPVRTYLVPATRRFLEARRCSPDLALPHARLATLDYLVERGEPTSAHAGRALRLTGYDHFVLVLAGQAAAQVRDLDLAARCWQKALVVHKAGWKEIAVAANMVMTPEQILRTVVPRGSSYPFLFADQVYTAPEWREARERFLRAALERLPGDDDLGPTRRLWLEGQIRARLGDRGRARKLMTDALIDEPDHPDWREEFIDWLVTWGDVEEASRQARIGLTLHPDHPGIQRALRSALDAFAKGDTKAARAN